MRGDESSPDFWPLPVCLGTSGTSVSTKLSFPLSLRGCTPERGNASGLTYFSGPGYKVKGQGLTPEWLHAGKFYKILKAKDVVFVFIVGLCNFCTGVKIMSTSKLAFVHFPVYVL